MRVVSEEGMVIKAVRENRYGRPQNRTSEDIRKMVARMEEGSEGSSEHGFCVTVFFGELTDNL